MATPGDGEGTPTMAPLTQADIPAVVQTVAEALKDQLRPPPSDAGHVDPANPGEGTAPRPGKSLLLRLAPITAGKRGLSTT